MLIEAERAMENKKTEAKEKEDGEEEHEDENHEDVDAIYDDDNDDDPLTQILDDDVNGGIQQFREQVEAKHKQVVRNKNL